MCSALNMLLPLPRYLSEARKLDSLPPGEGTIINSGPLALRKVRQFAGGWLPHGMTVDDSSLHGSFSDVQMYY
jgi:hypothetical protein